MFSEVKRSETSGSGLGLSQSPVASSISDSLNYLGRTVSLSASSEEPESSSMAVMAQQLRSYIQIVEERRLTDIAFFQSQNRELQERIGVLQQSGEALALENEQLKSNVGYLVIREQQKEVQTESDKVAKHEVSLLPCAAIGLPLFSVPVSIMVCGILFAGLPALPFYGIIASAFLLGRKFDKDFQLNERREYKGVVESAMNEYLLSHPNKFSEALSFATEKLGEYLEDKRERQNLRDIETEYPRPYVSDETLDEILRNKRQRQVVKGLNAEKKLARSREKLGEYLEEDKRERENLRPPEDSEYPRPYVSDERLDEILRNKRQRQVEKGLNAGKKLARSREKSSQRLFGA
ncbi:MAG: hypothetical protein ACHQUC_05325 [Chlamydiales bacterium]